MTREDLNQFQGGSTFQHFSMLPGFVLSVSRVGTEFAVAELTSVFKGVLEMNGFAVIFSIGLLVKKLGTDRTLKALSRSRYKLEKIIRSGQI